MHKRMQRNVSTGHKDSAHHNANGQGNAVKNLCTRNIWPREVSPTCAVAMASIAAYHSPTVATEASIQRPDIVSWEGGKERRKE